MKIIGMRIEKYIGQNIKGHSWDFEYYDEEMERHILYGINSDGQKIKITLYEEYGVCGSGWTTASWGRIEIEYIDSFEGYDYKPIKELIIDDITNEKNEDFNDYETECIENEVFIVSDNGGDFYYPCGFYEVNMDLFRKTARAKEKRPVWILRGNSNLGKSFLSHKTGLTVYETDCNELLPAQITEDIIVIGNKYSFTVNEVIDKLFGDNEIVIVDFKKYSVDDE